MTLVLVCAAAISVLFGIVVAHDPVRTVWKVVALSSVLGVLLGIMARAAFHQ